MDFKGIKYLKNEENGKLCIQCRLSEVSIEMCVLNLMVRKLLVILIEVDLVDMQGVCNFYYIRDRMSKVLKNWQIWVQM